MNGTPAENYVGLGDTTYKKRTTIQYDEWKTSQLKDELTLISQLLKVEDDTPASKAGLFYSWLDIIDVLKRRNVKL